MKNSKLNIKVIKTKPHKVYSANIEFDDQIKELCMFLRKQKDRQIEIIINGKSIKFNSVTGIKKFASGFERAFKIIEDRLSNFYKKSKTTEAILNGKLLFNQKAFNSLKKETSESFKKYRLAGEVMKIRIAAWEDRVGELEEDRVILMAEINRLRKKI